MARSIDEKRSMFVFADSNKAYRLWIAIFPTSAMMKTRHFPISAMMKTHQMGSLTSKTHSVIFEQWWKQIWTILMMTCFPMSSMSNLTSNHTLTIRNKRKTILQKVSTLMICRHIIISILGWNSTQAQPTSTRKSSRSISNWWLKVISITMSEKLARHSHSYQCQNRLPSLRKSNRI